MTVNESTAIEALMQVIYGSGLFTATTHLDLGNENFKPPASGIWCRFEVRHETGNQETLGAVGNRKFERTGFAVAQVFGPVDAGQYATTEKARTVRDLFEGQTISGIRIFGVALQHVGVSEKRWYQVNVPVRFEHTELK